MSYPANYDTRGLAPIIIIRDSDGTEQYRFEHIDVAATPIQQIKVTDIFIHTGINTDHGHCTISIDDRQNKLLDSSKRKKCLIKNGWQLEVYLGKTISGLQKWFVGIIQEPQVTRPANNLQQVTITAFGWGIRTAHRIGTIQRFQKKQSDGIDLDATDAAAKISEIFKDVLEDADVPILSGYGTESSIATTNVSDIDLKLPDFQRKYQTLGLMLSELAQMAGAVYGIDADKTAFLRLRGAVFGGFLISNDFAKNNLITRNWDQTKTMYTRNSRFNFRESTIDAGYTAAHGLGAQHDTIDYSQILANAVADLSARHYAFPFNPDKDNVSKLVPFLSKTNTPTMPMLVKIVGANTNGTPNQDDIRQATTISGIRLNELSQANYFEIPFDKDIVSVSHGEKLFMLITKYNDSTNKIRIDYQTGTGLYYSSADGTTWYAQTGNAKFRTYHSKTINIIGENVIARKSLPKKETMFSLVDFPNEDTAIKAFEGMLDVLGKIRRIYEPIIVSSPGTRPDIGKTIKVIDRFNSLEAELDLIGYDVSMSSFDEGNLKAYDITVYLEDWY